MHNEHLIIIINSNYQSWSAQQGSGFHFRRFSNYGLLFRKMKTPLRQIVQQYYDWFLLLTKIKMAGVITGHLFNIYFPAGFS
jgi:hypothetical protein